MNDKVKELIERMRLTDGEIKGIFLSHFAKQYGDEAAKQLFEQLPDCSYAKQVAQAQLNKVLKEDLALIDSGKELPSHGINVCANCWILTQNSMLTEGFTHSIIPLAEALEEEK